MKQYFSIQSEFATQWQMIQLLETAASANNQVLCNLDKARQAQINCIEFMRLLSQHCISETRCLIMSLGEHRASSIGGRTDLIPALPASSTWPAVK